MSLSSPTPPTERVALKIGQYTLRHGLMLAPMAGVSDRPMRTLCRSFGAEYTVSEMVSAKALCYEQKSHKKAPEGFRTAALCAITPQEEPMAIQLFGCEPEFVARAARMLESGDYHGACPGSMPAAIDINMGCPVPKVVGNGEGSALLREPQKAVAIVKATVQAVKLPVTVKIRLGWDKQNINAVEMAKRLEDAGAALLCVHGRTREQFYSPGVDREEIAAVKAAVSIPVVANGDIFSATDALAMFQQTGCDGIMIARGAQGNPWIFREITAALEGKSYRPPTPDERVSTALEQVRSLVALQGEKNGIAEARKHLGWYTKGISGSAAARARLMTAESLGEIESILRELIAP